MLKPAAFVAVYRGVARILEKEVLSQIKEGAKRPIFSRTAPKFGLPEATPLINDIIINLSAKLGVAER